MKYPKLFEPMTIGKVTINNRIALAPMGMVGLTTPDGHLTQRALDYYVERARGNVGLIITGLFKVENSIDACALDIARISPSSRWRLSEFCDTVHSLGSKIFIQLTAGFGRVLRPPRAKKTPVSASANPNYWDPEIICRPLETSEVSSIAASFGDAAQIVSDIGFDGIELHGHEGYLLDQFTTALWNRRTDKYGGDLKGRLTFPIEILSHIKERAGSDFPVQYRFGLKHYIKGLNQGALPGETFKEAGRDTNEGLQMAKMLEDAGFDALHVDAGCYDSWYWPHPPSYQEYGCMADLAAMVKPIVNIPVIAVGRLEIPELAEDIVRTKKADMIALGRGLLADPYWPKKTRAGQVSHIRPCVGCHGCFSRFEKFKPISCVLNPMSGREQLCPIKKATVKKDIIVVGGGIAGMEAARVARLRGHRVLLCEKEGQLGGHVITAGIPEFKKDLNRLLDWYDVELKESGVQILYHWEADLNWVCSHQPDALIVATGSKPNIPSLPGIMDHKPATCVDVLRGTVSAGKDVIIVGGGQIGCETALWLSQKNHNVTLVEELSELMQDGTSVPHMNRTMLTDLLANRRVAILTRTRVEEVASGGVNVVTSNGIKEFIPADTIVLATGMISIDHLFDSALSSDIPEVYAVGDCREVRNIAAAVWDAFEVARML